MFSLPVYADSIISVSTDKIQYDFGDIVTIFGVVNESVSDKSLLVQIIHDDSIIDIQQIPIDKNGNYSSTIILDGPSWKFEGKYVLRVSTTQDNISETAFFIGAIVDDSPSEIITDESNSYECEAESCIDDCNQDPNCTVSEFLINPEVTFPLPFVDPAKDPQSYVDRYNNEPKYKEWFDSNYPDYTIYQAVGLSEPIPEWVRGIFVFWADGKISDDDLKNAIKFLVTSDIIVLD